MLAFLACGALCAQRGGRLQLALPLFWVVHALAAIASVFWPAPERALALANLASLCAFGLAIALGAPGPRAIVFVMAVLFGASHGLANAGAIPPGANVLVVLAGVIVAAIASSAWAYAAIDFLLGLKQPWIDVAVRAAGSWIAAIGLLVLATTWKLRFA